MSAHARPAAGNMLALVGTHPGLIMEWASLHWAKDRFSFFWGMELPAVQQWRWCINKERQWVKRCCSFGRGSGAISSAVAAVCRPQVCYQAGKALHSQDTCTWRVGWRAPLWCLAASSHGRCVLQHAVEHGPGGAPAAGSQTLGRAAGALGAGPAQQHREHWKP